MFSDARWVSTRRSYSASLPRCGARAARPEPAGAQVRLHAVLASPIKSAAHSPPPSRTMRTFASAAPLWHVQTTDYQRLLSTFAEGLYTEMVSTRAVPCLIRPGLAGRGPFRAPCGGRLLASLCAPGCARHVCGMLQILV